MLSPPSGSYYCDAVPLRRDAKTELLKKVALFAGCSKGELRELAKIADETAVGEGTVSTVPSPSARGPC